MNNNKTMYKTIALIFIGFTVYQAFSFAQVEIIPFSTLTPTIIKNILIITLECILMIGLSIVVLYLLPLICVIELSTLFITLRKVNITFDERVEYINDVIQYKKNNIYRKHQVIRC